MNNLLKYLNNHKGAYFISSFIFDLLIFSSISFVAWHFYGIALILFWIIAFDRLKKVGSEFKLFFLESLKIVLGLVCGSIFWFIEMDKGIHAVTLVVFLYLSVFLLSFIFKKNVITSLIIILLIFEIILEYLPISYPGLINGNVMANQVYLVQWYSKLSVYAGSFWILVTSYIFHANRKLKFLFISISLALVTSLILNFQKPDFKPSINIVTVNTEHRKDLNDEKYIYNITKKLINLKNASLLIFPEQTLRGIDKDSFEKSLIFSYLIELIEKSSIESVIIGCTYFERGKYLANGYIKIDKDKIKFSSKNKLVPLSEYVPKFLNFLTDKKSFSKNVFPNSNEKKSDLKLSILVCYEAFFSLYTASKIDNNKNFAVILSSEQFLNNSYFGLIQYNNMVKLRALENNLNFLKVSSFANSILVDNRGDIKSYKKNEIQFFKL